MVFRMLALAPGLLLGAALTPLTAQSRNEISQHDRVLTATKLYRQITTVYPDLAREQFDKDYSEYLTDILNSSDDRRSFDLASMALVGTLHDGHSFFYDNWLAENYGQPTGLTVYSRGGRWVVEHSELATVHAGDVIEEIDGSPTQTLFERSRKYISASSERDATTSFFDTPVVFPQRFTLTLDGGRQVIVDRVSNKSQERPTRAEGRWLRPGSIAYIRVPTFRDVRAQAAALDYLQQFHEASAIIVDVRGNPGGHDPTPLQRVLMGRPYDLWATSSSVQGGFLLREYDVAYPEISHMTTTGATIMFRQPPGFNGRLILLIDRGCTCACEDFVMPFKVTGRAQLVGETTAGTFSFTTFTQFENGMMLNIASVRHAFPDGSRFEGVGITPMVEVEPSVQDLQAGKDVVLERAVALAASR